MEEYQRNKNLLTESLLNFINDFASWSKEDKDKITVSGLSFTINGLGQDKQNQYEGALGYWIDVRTAGNQIRRTALINCIKYLQDQ